ncbi:hypothetical protein [Leptotrichia trevisanii]|uniref:hypothetical protein n=1 Tax=Leptotrichia trevisanii TaxID=109328 RepID=UPI0026EC7DB8|nr:hypothetical protein [Leptotrichia trevisanii]
MIKIKLTILIIIIGVSTGSCLHFEVLKLVRWILNIGKLIKDCLENYVIQMER